MMTYKEARALGYEYFTTMPAEYLADLMEIEQRRQTEKGEETRIIEKKYHDETSYILMTRQPDFRLKVTVYDSFFKQELSGEFKSETEAREWYAEELGTNPEDVEIMQIVPVDTKIEIPFDGQDEHYPDNYPESTKEV